MRAPSTWWDLQAWASRAGEDHRGLERSYCPCWEHRGTASPCGNLSSFLHQDHHGGDEAETAGAIGSSRFFFAVVHAREDELEDSKLPETSSRQCRGFPERFPEPKQLRESDESEARKLLLWVRPGGLIAFNPRAVRPVNRVGRAGFRLGWEGAPGFSKPTSSLFFASALRSRGAGASLKAVRLRKFPSDLDVCIPPLQMSKCPLTSQSWSCPLPWTSLASIPAFHCFLDDYLRLPPSIGQSLESGRSVGNVVVCDFWNIDTFPQAIDAV